MTAFSGLQAGRRRLLQAGLAVPLLGMAGGAALAAPTERERNKAIVKDYIDATDRGDIARIDALAAPDVKWWIVSRGDFARDLVMTINKRRFPADVPRKSTIFGVAAEDDRVAVEYETRTVRDGEAIFIVYHHLFQVKDGKIASVREWTDPRVRAPRFKVSQIAPPGMRPWPDPKPGEVDEAQTRALAQAFLAPGPTNMSPTLTGPGYRWWVNGRGYDDMTAFFAKLTPDLKSKTMSETPISFDKRIPGMTVEGERAAVLITTDAVYPNHDYINRFHIVCRVRGGKIIEIREHTDRNASVKAGFPDI